MIWPYDDVEPKDDDNPPYLSLGECLQLASSRNKSQLLSLYEEIAKDEGLLKSKGSSHNHQTWEGGYVDHVKESVNIANLLYPIFSVRTLPFILCDAIDVLLVHDIEKPWKSIYNFSSKEERGNFRNSILFKFGIKLTPMQENALHYCEGENFDYKSTHRVMNELATFCHICDITSARIWHEEGKETKW